MTLNFADIRIDNKAFTIDFQLLHISLKHILMKYNYIFIIDILIEPKDLNAIFAKVTFQQGLG